jgi:hypothetical protein
MEGSAVRRRRTRNGLLWKTRQLVAWPSQLAADLVRWRQGSAVWADVQMRHSSKADSVGCCSGKQQHNPLERYPYDNVVFPYCHSGLFLASLIGERLMGGRSGKTFVPRQGLHRLAEDQPQLSKGRCEGDSSPTSEQPSNLFISLLVSIISLLVLWHPAPLYCSLSCPVVACLDSLHHSSNESEVKPVPTTLNRRDASINPPHHRPPSAAAISSLSTPRQ